jgi:hypothetical protein
VSASACDRKHAQEVELCIECIAIRAEITRLKVAESEMRGRECSLHGLIAKREAVLDADLRALAGSLDGMSA